MAMLVRQVAPSLPIHASTQMSITSADGADFARQLGAKRVVVGRELSIADISAVSAHTGAEVEAFVHGALCVSYRCVLHTSCYNLMCTWSTSRDRLARAPRRIVLHHVAGRPAQVSTLWRGLTKMRM